MVSHRSLALLALVLLGVGRASAAEWPQWRGPDGQGHALGTGYPLTWSETENVAWKAELPGRGHSSPVIDGERIWLTAAVEAPISEERKREKLAKNTGGQPLVLVGALSLRAVCVDRQTGELLHDIELL